MDTYQYIQPDGDGLEIGGEPDSKAVLIDRHRKLEAVLQICGTSCGFHWGAWLSKTRFALGAWQDADDFSQWKQGRLTIHSLGDSTQSSYVTRVVSDPQWNRYLAAWERWVLMRYRRIKA